MNRNYGIYVDLCFFSNIIISEIEYFLPYILYILEFQKQLKVFMIGFYPSPIRSNL